MNAAAAITPVRVEAEKRSRFNPLSDLTAEKLTQQLDEFRAGILRPLALTMEAVEERDDTLACVVPKAKAAVARHGWQVLTIETEDAAQVAQAEAQRAVLEFFYNHLRVTSALDQDELGGFSLLLRQMMDAKGKRYAVHNLVWQPQADGRYTVTAHFVPLWFFENTTGKLRFIRQPFGFYGEDMEPGAWLVTKGAGLMLPSVVAWMFKNLPLKDWLIYCARHGMPGIEGVTDEAEGTEGFTRLHAAVTAAAAGQLAWIRNRSSEINAIQFGAQGELPYPKLIERMDRALAAIWRGGDLSTMSKDGQAVGSNSQAGESDALEQDDAAWLSETLQMKLDRLVLDYVFGPGTPALAYVKVLTAKRQNLDADLKVDEFLLKHGFKLGVKPAAERYSRSLAGADEELLQAGSSASADGLPVGSAVPSAPPEAPAVNEAVGGPLAQSLGVPAAWLAPVADLLREIERKAADQSLSDADLQAFLTQAAARVPELFGQMDVAGLADAMEASLGQAVIAGVRDSLRGKASNPNPKTP